MGKEQELLEAARTGNRVVVERLLSGKRLSGAGPGGAAGSGPGASGGGSVSHPLSSLLSIWRGPNVNCVDSSGYTPLHHASLNGHKEVVEVLLRNEAVTSIADCKGCFPLHLAAWKGDAHIVKLLIHHGPSHAKVNEQNNDNETALHCAAQYGHTEVVCVLLEELTDPTMRNHKMETPLDLAALYGRLEVVKLLLNAHPNLLSCHTRKHTPLHLAARNGHRLVVKVLLDAAMDINYQTEKGSALHEAALFGKTDVVQMLLNAGIDVNITDNKGMTALDIVQELPSRKSQQIASFIQGHNTARSEPKDAEQDDQEPVTRASVFTDSQECGGSMQKALLDLRLDLDSISQSESPYEALYNASSCHSLDSICSGRSSDMDSLCCEIGKIRLTDRPPPPAKPPPEDDEELERRRSIGAIQDAFSNTTVDQDEENPYELLLTAETKRPDNQVIMHLEGDIVNPQVKARRSAHSQDPSRLADRRGSSDLSGGHSEGESHGSHERPNNEQRRNSSGGWSLASADSSDSHMLQHFSGLLHGSSPVCEGREPLVPCEPGGTDFSKNGAATHMELPLRHSLSKSDSDLLTCSPSPVAGGEDRSRSESLTNCTAGGNKKRLEKSPSFASEWDEIDKIMNSIGQGIEFSQEQQVMAGSRMPAKTVAQWLESVGLLQYESKFVLNGFDDIRFLSDNILEDQDLLDIGITDLQHRCLLLQAAYSLPKPFPLSWDQSITSWLRALSLQQYTSSFLSNGYISMETLRNLWELEIVNVLKVNLLGHRKRILASLSDRPCDDPPQKPPRYSQLRCHDVPPRSMPSIPLEEQDVLLDAGNSWIEGTERDHHKTVISVKEV